MTDETVEIDRETLEVLETAAGNIDGKSDTRTLFWAIVEARRALGKKQLYPDFIPEIDDSNPRKSTGYIKPGTWYHFHVNFRTGYQEIRRIDDE